MKLKNRCMALVLSVLICSGCARSYISLSLDLYNDDPILSSPLASRQIAQKYQDLQLLHDNVLSTENKILDALENKRISGSNSYANYSTPDIKKFNSFKNKVFSDISAAKVSLDNYTIKLNQYYNIKINDSTVSEIPYPKLTSRSNMLTIDRMILESKMNNVSGSFTDFKKIINDNKIDIFVKNYAKDTSSATNDDDNLINYLSRNNFMSSQIDRLQNYSDPIWRSITSEDNEDKWTRQFTKTEFWAECVFRRSRPPNPKEVGHLFR